MAHVTHLLAAFLLVALFAQVSAQATCPAVLACDDCQENSTCVDNACVCNEDGKVNFNCYSPANKHVCYVVTDPNIAALNGYHTTVQFFGSSKLVHLITDRTGGGHCQIRIQGWTSKFRGKFYMKGVYFRETYTPMSGPRKDTYGGVYGVEKDCDTEYSYLLKYGLTTVSNAVNVSAGEGVVVDNTASSPTGFIYKVAEGGFFQIESPLCGYKFGLRTFHADYPNRMPGFWFQVCDEHNPTFNCWSIREAPMCLEIDRTFGVNYTTLVHETGLTGDEMALIYFAVTNNYYTNYQGAPVALNALKNKLKVCPTSRLQSLIDNAYFFMNPHFINCISDDDDEYVSAVFEVVSYYCDADTTKCDDLLVKMNAKCSAQYPKIPGIADFVALNCPDII